jgi:hypothetical protein
MTHQHTNLVLVASYMVKIPVEHGSKSFDTSTYAGTVQRGVIFGEAREL